MDSRNGARVRRRIQSHDPHSIIEDGRVTMNAKQILDREFLEIRAKILEIAASFDRIDRAEGDVSDDPRMRRLAAAMAIVNAGQSNRAEQVQLLFSREYDPSWKTQFQSHPNS